MSYSQTLNFTWDLVVQQLWNKYPNPFAKHVIKEDVLERKICPDGSLYTKRLVLKNYMGSLPTWVIKHLASTKEYVIEESKIDLKNKVLSTLTRNIGSASKHAVLVEHVDYRPSGNTCVLNRNATVESNLNWSAKYPLKMFLLHRYKHTAKQSYRGIEYVCEEAAGSKNSSNSFKERIREKARSARDYAATKGPKVVVAQTNNS